MSQSFDQKELRNVLGSFLTGVTIVTSKSTDGALTGFTANSFTSVSLDPPLVLVCLANTSCNYKVFKNNASFAVNILADHQSSISNTFASKVDDRFAGIAVREEHTGSPIIEGCAAWLDCELHETVEGGDHIILIGRVIACGQVDKAPLGYYQGGYIDFGLGKEAALAAEVAARESSVAALLESDQGILMVDTDGGELDLPTAHNLGGDDGLLQRLTDMGLSAEIGFLFSVFEDSMRGGSYTCYRGSASGDLQDDSAHWIALDNIPYHRVADPEVRSMLKRFADEHKADAFGVVGGDEESGPTDKSTLSGS